MDAIFEALEKHEISVAEAIERVFNNPEHGGCREDAVSVVDEWLQELDARQEDIILGKSPARF